MSRYEMKFDQGELSVEVPGEDLLGILRSREVPCAKTEEEAVRSALENPIGTPRLRDIVKPGERICIVTCDVTRLWQHPSLYLEIIVEELLGAGVLESDIFFLSGTGTHRNQSPEEHKALLGEKLYSRHKIYDHQSKTDAMTDFGVTSRGTPIKFNKRATDSDHIVVTGGIVYHFMAGWGGGKKGILPGIASYDTVMKNHSLALSPIPGEGRNMDCSSGTIEKNLIHLDMVEAVAKLAPSFLFNVIMNAEGRIGWAVAGDWQQAYQKGMDIVDSVEAIPIDRQADLVIASACGFPKDINFYQSTKAIFNGREALRPGGAMLLIAACPEGYGNQEVQRMLLDYPTNAKREAELRREFTIAKHVGFCTAEVAEQYDFHIVTRMDPALLEGTGITSSPTVEEAMKKIHARHGNRLKTWLMPQASNTLPKLQARTA
ncbi:MAG: nickel-dependent lactate racemase [Fretibacterium sp.]|nr:nickel-dependent lactate racemase [Fretibacterium sp.]